MPISRSISEPAMAVARNVPVLFLLSVIRSTLCTVCDTQLAGDSYSCCMQPYQGYTNCSFLYKQLQCEPGDQWEATGESCDQYNSATLLRIKFKSDDERSVTCRGVANPEVDKLADIDFQDPSTYDKHFSWFCSKPPTQATILLDPPAGHITAQSDTIYLNVTMENCFPEAFSYVELPSGETLDCISRYEYSADWTDLMNITCHHKIDLMARETNFTVQVQQQGVNNQVFHYKVTTEEWITTTTWFPLIMSSSRSENRIGNTLFIIFLTCCFYALLK